MGRLTSTPPRKGYATLYVKKEEDIQKVKDIIKEMDEFEFDYMPDTFIQVWNGEDKPCYTGKFDSLDLYELSDKLFVANIFNFYVEYSRYFSE